MKKLSAALMIVIGLVNTSQCLDSWSFDGNEIHISILSDGITGTATLTKKAEAYDSVFTITTKNTISQKTQSKLLSSLKKHIDFELPRGEYTISCKTTDPVNCSNYFDVSLITRDESDISYNYSQQFDYSYR